MASDRPILRDRYVDDLRAGSLPVATTGNTIAFVATVLAGEGVGQLLQ